MILTLQQEHNIPRARSLPPTVIQAVSMVQKEEERRNIQQVTNTLLGNPNSKSHSLEEEKVQNGH
jgi:hypothetical protein